jgi:hypothetical protein
MLLRDRVENTLAVPMSGVYPIFSVGELIAVWRDLWREMFLAAAAFGGSAPCVGQTVKHPTMSDICCG